MEGSGKETPMQYTTRLSLGIAGCLAAAWVSAASAQSPHTGQYECWANNRARTMLNFTLQPNGQYTDANGERGTYSFDGRNVAFRGGALDGQHPVYEVRKRRPTMSFIGVGSAEAAFCEAAGRF
jgi:hypothetical protein